MSRRSTVFDTNVYIQHRLPMITGSGLLSSVVLQELTAGARDAAEVRRLGTVRARATADGTLLVPDGEDWWFAGKVLNALYHGAEFPSQGSYTRHPQRGAAAARA